MAEKRITIHAGEAAIISKLMAERNSVTDKLTVAANMVCAREGILFAMLERIEGDVLVMNVPDDEAGTGHPEYGGTRNLKLDRTESSQTGRETFDGQSIADRSESPPAGNPEAGARPVVEPPDVAKGS